MKIYLLVTATRHIALMLPKITRRPAQRPRSARLAALGICLLASFFCLCGSAQSYSIGWYKIAGGGGASTNGPYSLTGTIGQTDAGVAMAGGNYSVTGGFWSLISAVQTPGAPLLHITRSCNGVIVSWTNTASCTLQQNNNLASGSWTTCGYGVTTNNGTCSVNIGSPAGNLFFRLSK